MKTEQIKSTGRIGLVQIKDFPSTFKRKWMMGESGFDFMKKGWTTWTTVGCMEDAVEDGEVILEENEYENNFPREYFKVIN